MNSFPLKYNLETFNGTPGFQLRCMGWSGGAMVLGKLPVPGHPANLNNSRARAYCAYSRCGWSCLDIFTHIYHFSLLSPSLGDGPIHV